MTEIHINDPQPFDEDLKVEKSLRPNQIDEFIGQKEIVDSLKLYIEAANNRGDSLDHVLFFGPPGLGKTTLSVIIARELGVNIKQTSGPVLDRAGDLAGILTSLENKDVFFIDEIHRLNAIVEEYLYSAMEDYKIEIMIDKGPSARSVQLNVEPFSIDTKSVLILYFLNNSQPACGKSSPTIPIRETGLYFAAAIEKKVAEPPKILSLVPFGVCNSSIAIEPTVSILFSIFI